MNIHGSLFLGLFLAIQVNSFAQATKEKCRKIPASHQFEITDSLTIIPGSVRFIPSEGVSFVADADQGKIKVTNRGNQDSLEVCYRVIPYALNHYYHDRPMSDYDSGNNLIQWKSAIPKSPGNYREEIFHSEGLAKSGSLTRGISFGNNQDLYVNSALNLQMEGKLSPSLNIRASITDQNIPYQPEGNTMLVQDFDNVFIELFNDHISLLGGDMMLQSGDSWFLKYRRNVMGARLLTHYQTGNSGQAVTSLAVSASKGKFSSYTIEPMDGVLGPYRIYGPGHEKFIIILSNSEKIFLDGRPLQRGFNFDYVIDYNNAEVTFTSRVLITRYSRIIVEFQYNDQSYGRSLMTLSHEQKIGKFNVHLNYYQEKDDPSRPFALDLSDNQKILLGGVRSLGDFASIPGADSVGYNPGKILYALADTLNAEGRKISIYRYTSNPDSAIYQVTFTEVGSNKGNYEKRVLPSGYAVYDWVFPAKGTPQGDYEPLRKIPLPDKEQVFDAGISYDLSGHEKLTGEIALSEHDNNLFSGNKTSRQNGSAYRLGFVSSDRPVLGINSLLYNGGASLEYSGNGFRPVDRVHPVEFDRDWSYDPASDSLSVSDLLLNMTNRIHGRLGFLNQQLSRRMKDHFINGWQNTVSGALNISRLNISGDLYLMDNQISRRSSHWLRYHVLTQYHLRYIMPGYEYSSDRNVIYIPGSDSVTGSAGNYDEHLFYIKNSDSLKTRFNIQYSIRNDRLPQSGEMVEDNQANTLGINLDRGSPDKGRISVGLYLRKINSSTKAEEADKTLNGHIDWDQPMFKNNIRSEFSYSIGSGRELRREYTFFAVPNGMGTHTWRDDNGDGIKQLDEFYPAVNADEKNYIKIFIPTDDYVQAYDHLLNYRLSAGFPGKWRNQTGLAGFLYRFSNVLSITADQKNSRFGIMNRIWDNEINSFNPDIISEHGRLRNILYFNRQDRVFGMDVTYDMTTGKNLYSQGFEGRSVNNLIVNSRLNFSREYSFRLNVNRGQTRNGSDYLQGRNYFIHTGQLTSSFSWQPTGFYRLTLNLAQTLKNNSQGNIPGSSRMSEGGLNLRVSKANDKAIECSIRYTGINFNGDKNTAVGYELLNGLQPGSNMIWSLNCQQKLLNGLQMNIIYEGRKSGDLKVIHTGRMQVTALF